MSHRYIDKLDDFAYSYNHTPHRSLKNMSPSEVTPEVEASLWKHQYLVPFMNKKKRKKKYKFKIGDTVRVSFLRSVFDREYTQKWSGEVFTVTKRYYRKHLPVYRVKDYSGEAVQGTFYEPELQKIIFDENQPFKVEKVLKTKGKGKNKKYFVRWLHWPKKYNSWVSSFT